MAERLLQQPQQHRTMIPPIKQEEGPIPRLRLLLQPPRPFRASLASVPYRDLEFGTVIRSLIPKSYGKKRFKLQTYPKYFTKFQDQQLSCRPFPQPRLEEKRSQLLGTKVPSNARPQICSNDHFYFTPPRATKLAIWETWREGQRAKVGWQLSGTVEEEQIAFLCSTASRRYQKRLHGD